MFLNDNNMIRSNKSIYFLIGLIVGVVIGSSVVWWIQNYDFKIWFTFSGKNKQEISIADDNKASDNLNDKQPKKAHRNIAKPIPVKKEETLSSEDDTTSIINQNNEHLTDTSSNYNEVNNNSPDEIVVAKDELLFAKIIKIEGIDKNDSKKDALLDSLLINDKTKKPAANSIKVEFWRSPINYKGYKYSNNKLILFGIYMHEEAILESRNDKLYLNYENTFYLIEKADDFHPLMAVKPH